MASWRSAAGGLLHKLALGCGVCALYCMLRATRCRQGLMSICVHIGLLWYVYIRHGYVCCVCIVVYSKSAQGVFCVGAAVVSCRPALLGSHTLQPGYVVARDGSLDPQTPVAACLCTFRDVCTLTCHAHVFCLHSCVCMQGRRCTLAQLAMANGPCLSCTSTMPPTLPLFQNSCPTLQPLVTLAMGHCTNQAAGSLRTHRSNRQSLFARRSAPGECPLWRCWVSASVAFVGVCAVCAPLACVQILLAAHAHACGWPLAFAVVSLWMPCGQHLCTGGRIARVGRLRELRGTVACCKGGWLVAGLRCLSRGLRRACFPAQGFYSGYASALVPSVSVALQTRRK